MAELQQEQQLFAARKARPPKLAGDKVPAIRWHIMRKDNKVPLAAELRWPVLLRCERCDAVRRSGGALQSKPARLVSRRLPTPQDGDVRQHDCKPTAAGPERRQPSSTGFRRAPRNRKGGLKNSRRRTKRRRPRQARAAPVVSGSPVAAGTQNAALVFAPSCLARALSTKSF